MKIFIQSLMVIGKITFAKSGKGLFIYNPKAFSLSTVENTATKLGLMVIDSPRETMNPRTGLMVPPHLYVGPAIADKTEDEVLAHVESMLG